MPKFIVKNTPILHNGKRYEIGDRIEMTAEEASNNALFLQVDEKALAAEQAEAERKAAEEKAKKEAEKAAKASEKELQKEKA